MNEKNIPGPHPTIIRTCENLNCRTKFVVQIGGQKAGSSPAVHVERIGQSPKGYCSTRCLHETKGWSLYPLEEWYASLGMNFDTIFPPGYLAPSRRTNSDHNLDGGDQ